MTKLLCELCKSTAKLYCESDSARLCWDCDFMVHGANFLVARHSRTLLCRSCQSPTPWSASGAKLNTTVSVCRSCVEDIVGMDETVAVRCQVREEVVEVRDDIYWEDELSLDEDGDDEEDDDDDDDDEDDDDDDDESIYFGDVDGDNQVVPCSSTCSSPPPPPPPSPPQSSSSSSSGDEYYPMNKRLSSGSSHESSPISARLKKRSREGSTYPQIQQDQALWSSGSTVVDSQAVTGAQDHLILTRQE